MSIRRCTDIVGIILMGDAFTHFLNRKSHIKLWQEPEAEDSLYNKTLEYLAENPVTTAALSTCEFALGLALAYLAEATVSAKEQSS